MEVLRPQSLTTISGTCGIKIFKEVDKVFHGTPHVFTRRVGNYRSSWRGLKALFGVIRNFIHVLKTALLSPRSLYRYLLAGAAANHQLDGALSLFV